MYRNAYIGALMLAALAVPAAASAQSIEEQAKSLMQQIQALQLQLKTLLASSTISIKFDGEKPLPPGQIGKALCIELARDLRVGSEGEDVRKLQEMLAADPESGFRAKATGFFGPLTATAMAKYQVRMGIASSTDGRVGPMTRAFFHRACGKGLGAPGDHMAAAIRGEITASSASSITIKPKDGSSLVVNITASTSIKVHATATSTPAAGTVSDLTVGKTVMAEGSKNSDGTLTARMIIVGVLPPLPERPDKPEKPEPPRKPLLPF